MTNFTHPKPPDDVRFFWPGIDKIAVDLAYTEATEEQVRAFAAQLFTAGNPDPKQIHDKAVLKKAAKTVAGRIARLNHYHRRTDPVHRTLSAEQVCKPNRVTRIAGGLTGLMGIALLVPMPFLVGAGIHESGLIERVIEDPSRALLYGLAPFGGIIAAHGARDAVNTDRTRRWVDLSVYTGAVASFGLWAWQFGPTFLADPLAGFGAAADSSSSLSDFYLYHLSAEFFGAAAAYTAAVHMLTSSARVVVNRSETCLALEVELDREAQAQSALAASRDRVESLPNRYDAALLAFQEHCMLKVAVARKLFKAEAANASTETLERLRRELLNTNHGDN